MTAEQILDDKETFSFLRGAEKARVIIAMKYYAKIKCQEQRQIIATGLPDRAFVDMDESYIAGMEAPEFE